jgi:hypothetical protein
MNINTAIRSAHGGPVRTRGPEPSLGSDISCQASKLAKGTDQGVKNRVVAEIDVIAYSASETYLEILWVIRVARIRALSRIIL